MIFSLFRVSFQRNSFQYEFIILLYGNIAQMFRKLLNLSLRSFFYLKENVKDKTIS
ncbi:hypothetical protein CHCC14821_3606 [Bacillus paralicheniformis]|nr:hypothetical protein CHCC14821_3606 [Bacillus paralicheniformis]TWM62410.1 hypothetical protein CHCC14814_1963 [Bacillus paralicheniformis]